MGYTLLGHTADIAVEATGETVESIFAALGDGLAAAQCDEIPSIGSRFEVTVVAESIEALLFDYLDELIYQRDVRAVLPTENRVTIAQTNGDYVLEGSARGVPLGEINAREIKAVTYSEMVIQQSNGEWYGYVVFDV